MHLQHYVFKPTVWSVNSESLALSQLTLMLTLAALRSQACQYEERVKCVFRQADYTQSLASHDMQTTSIALGEQESEYLRLNSPRRSTCQSILKRLLAGPLSHIAIVG